MSRSDGLESIAVVIPTLNRPSLERAVESAAGADEIVVVGDHVWPRVGTKRLKSKSEAMYPAPRAADLRNLGMRHVMSAWIAFVDDDDVFTPGAIAMIRQVVSGQQRALYLFRMTFGGSDVRWREPVIEQGNVGTPMIVCPALGYKPWPTDGYRHEDHGFADLNRSTWSGGVVFRDEVIARVRP